LPKETRKTPRRRLKSAPPGADDRLARLAAIAEVRADRRPSPGAAKLLAAGAARTAHTLIEEAAETGKKPVAEIRPWLSWSAWTATGEALLRMAEKLSKTPDPQVSPPAAEQSFEP
jgi:hypothetical protein